MFYVFYGEEEFRRSEEVARFREEIARDGMGDLNISVFDGRSVDLGELINACSAVPFLTERRLIIVENLLRRLEGVAAGNGEQAPPTSDRRELAERLCAFLPHLPDTTRLVFVEQGKLGKRNPVLRLAAEHEKGYVKEYAPLNGPPLQAWIRWRASTYDVGITPRAVELLVAAVGNDLRRIDQELGKLSAYAAYGRDITEEDVRALVSADVEEDIFALVDSLGHRQGAEAMRLLRRALEARANELYLLSMIARQVRLLLAARDLAERGVPSAEIQRRLRLHPYVARKLQPQVGRFTLEELDAMHRRIVAADGEIKTGRIEPALALELLVLDICRRPAREGGYQGRNRLRTRSAKASSSSSPEPRSR